MASQVYNSQKNTSEVVQYSDDDLIAAIKEAREMAQGLCITRPHLRMRFIMLGVFRLPRFWEHDAGAHGHAGFVF